MMLRKPPHTLASLMFVMAMSAHAQGITFNDVPLPNAARAGTTAAKPAAPASAPSAGSKATAKAEVELLCEGTLRVFYVLPDGNERDSGAEHRHDVNLRVIDKKAFRSFDDSESAIQIRFEDPKACLGRSNGAACMRQVDNPDGRRISVRDYFDIDRYTGRMIYNYVRSYPEPVQHGGETISAARLEYNGLCGRADAPRAENKPVGATPAPAAVTPKVSASAPAIRRAPADGKPTSIWVIKEPAPEVKR